MATLNISDVDVKLSCMTLASFDVPPKHRVSMAIALTILTLLTILSNAILMYTLFKTKQLNTISNKLTMIMSISDLCLGAIAIPMIVFLRTKRHVLKGCALEKATSFITLSLSFFSFLMLYCISIDRYFRVMKMNHYNLYMNDFKMKLMIIASLVIATVISLAPIIYPSFEQQVVSVLIGSFFVIFAIVVYIFLLRRLRSHTRHFKRLGRVGPNSNATSNSTGTSALGNNTEGTNGTDFRSTESGNSQLSTTKTIHVLLMCLSISYGPFQIISCIWAYFKFREKTDPGLYLTLFHFWASFISLFNACGNSWIIIFGSKRSRRFVLSLFRNNRISNNTN